MDLLPVRYSSETPTHLRLCEMSRVGWGSLMRYTGTRWIHRLSSLPKNARSRSFHTLPTSSCRVRFDAAQIWVMLQICLFSHYPCRISKHTVLTPTGVPYGL